MKNLYFTIVMLWLTLASYGSTITGSVSNYSDDTGKLNVLLYTQANYSAFNFQVYADLFQQTSPGYPVNYILNVPSAGTYAVVVYLDTNNNGTIDLGEPADAIENIEVASDDLAGQDFIFGDAPLYSISGDISYAGTMAGDVYTYVFKQSDFLAQNLTSPVGILKSSSPSYPIAYAMEVPEPETYVVFTFIDENGSGAYTVNETVAYQMNVVISDANKTAEVNLVLPDADKVSVGGTISYDGITIGKLYIVAFNQSEYEVGNFTNPLNIAEVEDPYYPYSYDVLCPDQSECALLAFIDYNGNQNYDADEPYASVENIITGGVAITGKDMMLEEPVEVTAVFKLDTLTSTWDNGTESGTFHLFKKGYYTPGELNGRTALTMDSFDEGTKLYGFGFWIDETNMDELDSSYWEAGTKLHMEYTFPDSLDINFIAVGSLVDGVKIFDGRLIIDVEVVDPVHSASGDFNASCGISVSCDAEHSGGVDCYGAIFYGDLYARDMSFVVSRLEDRVGMRVNGYDGVEGHFTALLPDSFLINVLQFSGDVMPISSEVLDGFVPDLTKGADYTVSNDFSPITTGFDIDGDGIDNKMYKLTINNSRWSAHDLVFGAAEVTGVEAVESQDSDITITENTLIVNKRLNKLVLYDITGKLMWSKTGLVSNKIISLENVNSGVYILNVDDVSSYKIVKR